MGLREIAALDCQKIHEDTAGFATAMTVTDPEGVSAELTGTIKDIGISFDPDTGELVAGRVVTANISMLTLADKGLEVPRNITENKTPWTIAYTDVKGVARTTRVIASYPNHTFGFVTCRLGDYTA